MTGTGRVAEALGRLQAGWPAAVSLGGTEASMYDAFPQLFAGAFPGISDDALHRLTLASRLFATAIFLHDKIVDDGPEAAAARTPTNAVRTLALQFEAYRLLHDILPARSAFWGDLRGYLADFAQACVDEQRFATGGRPWSECDPALARRMALGKNGISRAVVAGLAALHGDRAALAPLTASIDAYNLASQVLDDLTDWQQDLAFGSPSSVLVRVLDRRPERSAGEDRSGEVGRRIYYDGHATALLDAAIAELDANARAVAAFAVPRWHAILAERRTRCADLRDNVERIVAENVRRIARQPEIALALPPPAGRREALAWRGLEHLVERWRHGFGEARHLMRFPAELGLGGPELQRGDVFQRAIIADVLCDARCAGIAVDAIVDYEAAYLLERRRSRAGWSYFPDLPELPPDADDLAQIMQVFARTGRGATIEAVCAEPLAILFDENAYADGSFETWIVPAAGRRTAMEERQAICARELWGTGPDPEVVANLLYALHLAGSPNHAERVERGAAYVARSQSDDGAWYGTWYAGPYYGTYAATRLLAAVHPAEDVLGRAAAFLRTTQRADGGWGDGESTALETALALLGLRAVGEDGEAVDRGFAYLEDRAAEDGGWAASPFIRMEIGRAAGGPTREATYESRTMTTAYVVKASLAWMERGSA